MLPLIGLILAVYSLAPGISALETNCSCPNINAHPNPTKWMKDEMAKSVNILMMSKANYIYMVEMFTGRTKIDISEHACFKAQFVRPKDNENGELTIHGYKSVAAYECTYVDTKQPTGCVATSKSTNEEWAKKLPLGRPTTIFSDDKSYTVEVRCPRNHERVWHVLSNKDSLSLEEQMKILSILKAHGFEVEGAFTFCNSKCEK